MPVKSKSQGRFMRAAESGSIKVPGLSRKKAAEFVEGVPTKSLPEKVNRFSKLKNKLRKTK